MMSQGDRTIYTPGTNIRVDVLFSKTVIVIYDVLYPEDFTYILKTLFNDPDVEHWPKLGSLYYNKDEREYIIDGWHIVRLYKGEKVPTEPVKKSRFTKMALEEECTDEAK